jgi:aspartate dehydrogenase
MSRKTRFVIGGFGNVGQQLASAVLADSSGRLEIAAISGTNLDLAKDRAKKLGLEAPVIPVHEAFQHADVLVEASTYEGFRDVVEPAINAGMHVIALSVGALGVNLDLIDLADIKGATLQIASGTLPGLDIVRAAREGDIESVKLESQILPGSLVHESYIAENGIDLDAAKSGPVHIFSGTAREAALLFPRHFNVAVSLSLAGIGLDKTHVQIHANGTLLGCEHIIKVKANTVELEMKSNNLPSPANNRTSRIVAPSVLAALRELSAPLRIGS